MKYIVSKKIFEATSLENARAYNYISFENKYDLLKEFCDDNLAYLKDAGFVYKVDESVVNLYNSNQEVCIKIIRRDLKEFTWEDVKYDLIPFVQLLRRKYSMKRKFRYYKPSTNLHNGIQNESNITEIINDTIPNDTKILSLYLYLNNRVGDKNWNKNYNTKQRSVRRRF
jgi:hypothetical protein